MERVGGYEDQEVTELGDHLCHLVAQLYLASQLPHLEGMIRHHLLGLVRGLNAIIGQVLGTICVCYYTGQQVT